MLHILHIIHLAFGYPQLFYVIPAPERDHFIISTLPAENCTTQIDACHMPQKAHVGTNATHTNSHLRDAPP